MKTLSITHCSALKAVPSRINLDGAIRDQADVASDWIHCVNRAPSDLEARKMYVGRGFKSLAARVEGLHELFIVSAGLGLVDGDSRIPSYDCTIASGSNASLDRFCDFRPNLPDWWQSLESSQYTCGSIQNVSRRYDLLLVSLTANYLKMVEQDIRAASCKVVLFTSPTNWLDRDADQIIQAPYNSSFDGPESPSPGTKSDFAQRCHTDFIARLEKHKSINHALDSVREDMSKWSPQKKLNNQKFDDAEISRLIQKHKNDFSAINSMHRFFRHELNVACEQKRFTKLYRQILG